MSLLRKFVPRTLLVRTFLMLSLLIFVSVASWLTLFALAEREPDGLAPIAHGASREADADESQRKGARDGARHLLWIERHRCPSIVKYAH